MAPNLCDITSEWRVSTHILPNDYQEKAASDQEHDAGIVGGSESRKRKRQRTHHVPAASTAPGMLQLFFHSVLITALPARAL